MAKLDTPKALIEYRCNGCEDVHAVTVENAEGAAFHYMRAILEMLIMSGVRDLAIFDVADGNKEDMTPSFIRESVAQAMADMAGEFGLN